MGVVGQPAQIMVIEKIPGDSTGPTPTAVYPDGQPDGKVDIFDLVNMARHWHQTEDNTTASVAEFKALDISDQQNSNGKVDIFDLVYLASNYGQGMTRVLAAPSILATLPIYQDAVSDLRVVTSTVTDQSTDQIRTLLANQIELDIFLDQVEGLYAYSFDLVYDREKVELVMQDNGQPAFEKGSILGIDAGTTHSIVSPTPSSDETGLASVNVTATHLGQKTFDQQSGSLGRLQLRTKAAGQSQLQVQNLILVTQSGEIFTLADQTYNLTVHHPVQQTRLNQNYPNPFNPETWIPFQLKSASQVTITVYDTTGKVVRELDVGYRVSGPHHSRQEAAYW